jgi:hypothetical protein
LQIPPAQTPLAQILAVQILPPTTTVATARTLPATRLGLEHLDLVS